MLLLVKNGIRGGICPSIYRYAKANNKYLKDYNKKKKSLCIQYWDVSNLYGWAMSQKLSVNNFEWIKDTSQFIEDFIKNYVDESDERNFLEVDVQHLEKLLELHDDLSFLPERIEIEKVKKLVTNLHDKNEYVTHIRNLKQISNQRLVLKNVHRVIKFNQKAWVKACIDMSTGLRKNAKYDFEKDFFKLLNNDLVSEPNYDTTKFFTENLISIEMKK